jgi:hypothetical protein
MDREKARKQDAMVAKHLGAPNLQGGSGEISTKEAIDLDMESCPILIALSNNPPELTNNKPHESKEMVLLRSKQELKEKQKLEKQKIA